MAASVLFLRRIVEDIDDCRFAWEARDGKEAVAKCQVEQPDLILMDPILPVMDGVEATRRIMQQTPCAILIVTAEVEKNASRVFEALGEGALDAANMPRTGDGSSEALIRKIRTIGKLIRHRGRAGTADSRVRSGWNSDSNGILVAIGSSTGGPTALRTILSDLPVGLPAAVVIAQHVDRQFAPAMAQWLNNACALPVREAEDGERPAPGVVLMASTNDHLVFTEKQTLTYTPHPHEAIYRPSVDEFFTSAGLHWKGKIIAVLLSGMGRDGARGLLALNRLGKYTIAQDGETCAVYSMPKAAVELGAVRKQLPPARIGKLIRSLASG